MKNSETHEHATPPALLWLGAMAFFIIGFAVYWPALTGGFVWDDDAMLTANPLVQAEDGLNAIWFSTQPTDYFPLTYTSFWLEWKLWGLNPMGYHATNILLHAASCVLLWRVLANAKIPGGWLAGLLFLAHPVNVESVAWIAERKNTLALFFYLLTLRLFLQFERTGQRRLYIFSWLAFALSLLSKPAGVMLPFVLLGLAWWQRSRASNAEGREPASDAPGAESTGSRPSTFNARLVLRVLPFFGLALALGLVTVWFQSHRAIGDEVIHTRDFGERLAGAGWAVWFYLYKAIWPLYLSFVYPEWTIDSASVVAYLPGAGLLGVFFWLWTQRRKVWGRTLLAVLGYFVLLLLPVLGFVPIYFQKYSWVADHWQYFALPAWLALVGAGEDRLAHQQFGKGPERPSVLFIRGVWCSLLAGLFLALTFRQAMIYKDGATLWRDTLQKNPQCWLAYNNLGLMQAAQSRWEEAIGLYQQGLRVKPEQVEGHNNLGSAFYAQGQWDEALAHYEAALKVNPAEAMTHYNIGNALDQLGKRPAAAAAYREALRLRPDYAAAHNNLAGVLTQEGEIVEAVAHFHSALQAQPDYVDALSNLGGLLVELGKADEAKPYLEKAVALNPDHADARHNLGNNYRALQKIPDAIAQYQEAVRLQPALTAAHYKLGDLLLKMGEVNPAMEQFSIVLAQQPDWAEAHYQMAMIFGVKLDKEGTLEHLRAAVRLKPNWVEALNNLAWFLATNPRATFLDGVEAVKFAQRACEITAHQSAGALDTLGAAYAQTEQFSEAVDAAQKAHELAMAAAQTNLAAQIESRMERYRQHQPYRER